MFTCVRNACMCVCRYTAPQTHTAEAAEYEGGYEHEGGDGSESDDNDSGVRTGQSTTVSGGGFGSAAGRRQGSLRVAHSLSDVAMRCNVLVLGPERGTETGTGTGTPHAESSGDWGSDLLFVHGLVAARGGRVSEE